MATSASEAEAGMAAPCRGLRADAARNRALILETAAQLFAEQGIDAGYDEIARRAGVGVGTVYRRFPERSELVRALFESRIDEMVDIGERAAAFDKGWDGLAWFLERMLERQVCDRGLKEVVMTTLGREVHEDAGRDRIWPILDDIVDRAHREGTLRADVGATDIAMQVMLVSSLSPPGQPELWHRGFALLLDGLRARPDLTPLPGRVPAHEAMFALMSHLHGGQA
jgi:AcrR family transcriptional regulator